MTSRRVGERPDVMLAVAGLALGAASAGRAGAVIVVGSVALAAAVGWAAHRRR